MQDRYDIHLEPLHGPLELIDVEALAASVQPWWNQTLVRVNDCVVRLAVVEGEFHWHSHEDEDEFFYVIEGRWRIEYDGGSVELAPGEAFNVPRGMRHKPTALERTVILMIEGAGVVPTGDEGVSSG
jgi:mannose-6-phosphate isomerase-like protein (cupin superfamily)